MTSDISHGRLHRCHGGRACGFLADYDVGELLAYKGIAEGVENSNFLRPYQSRIFILTLYEKRVAAKDLPFFLDLMEHLHARGLTCPQPVKTKQGEMLGKVAGRPAAIITFLDGMWIRRPSSSHCAALGEALPSCTLPGSISASTAPMRSRWKVGGRSTRIAATARMSCTAISSIARAELAHLETTWPRDLPEGVIHADLFPDNVFFLGNKLSGLIDFYFACTDALAYDVAICLNAWCFETDHSYNVTKGKSLLQAYTQMRPLSATERQALPLLARGASMRFLLTRLVDWFDVPPARWCVRRTRWNITASCVSIRASRACAITVFRKTRERAACGHPHRRRLLGQSRPGRLGRHSRRRQAREGTQGRRAAHHQQPHGAHGRDRGARSAEAAVPRRSPHRQPISA